MRMKNNILIALIAICLLSMSVFAGCAEKSQSKNDAYLDANTDFSQLDNSGSDIEDITSQSKNDAYLDANTDFPQLDNNGSDIEDITALANEIFDELEDDYRIAAAILTNQVSKPVNYSDGVDKNGNLREIDGDWYIPLVEEYDTADEIMAVFRRVYTEQKCDELYSDLFGEDGYMKEIDGTLYCGDGDIPYYPFNVPIESAKRISDIEILAKTSVTYDSGDVPYEITFKYEHEKWRIDKLSEDGREVNY